MRTVLTIVGVMTLVVGLSWPSGAEPVSAASSAESPHLRSRLELLGCQMPMPDLPPKDLSKLPEFECR